MQRFIRERKTSYLRSYLPADLCRIWLRADCHEQKDGSGGDADSSECHNPECNHLLYPGRELSAESWLPEKTLRTSL